MNKTKFKVIPLDRNGACEVFMRDPFGGGIFKHKRGTVGPATKNKWRWTANGLQGWERSQARAISKVKKALKG